MEEVFTAVEAHRRRLAAIRSAGYRGAAWVHGRPAYVYLEHGADRALAHHEARVASVDAS